MPCQGVSSKLAGIQNEWGLHRAQQKKAEDNAPQWYNSHSKDSPVCAANSKMKGRAVLDRSNEWAKWKHDIWRSFTIACDSADSSSWLRGCRRGNTLSSFKRASNTSLWQFFSRESWMNCAMTARKTCITNNSMVNPINCLICNKSAAYRPTLPLLMTDVQLVWLHQRKRELCKQFNKHWTSTQLHTYLHVGSGTHQWSDKFNIVNLANHLKEYAYMPLIDPSPLCEPAIHGSVIT